MRKPTYLYNVLDELHKVFRSGLEIDGDSKAAALAFDAVSAFHKGKYDLVITYITEAKNLNQIAWEELFNLLTIK